MVTQLIEFGAPAGQTVTARLFLAGSDAVVQTASAVTAKVNDSGDYTATFADVPAGVYRLKATNAAGAVLARWWVDLTLTAATFQAYELPRAGFGTTLLESRLTDARTASLDAVVLAENPNTRTVKITGPGAGHIAADVHQLQPDVITADSLAADAVTELQSGLALQQTQLSVKAVTDKLNPGLVASGSVWQFTANMLALGPSSSGGDATASNQQVIIQHLEQIKGTGWSSTDTLEAIRDLVSAGVGSALATLGFTAGTITGFPTTLRVGDSYVSAVNRSITVFLRDQANNPITSLGSKNFSDADFAPSVTISQEGNAGRVETTVGWVPPANGNEGYLQIQIPSSASKSARVGAATVQVRLRWTGIDVTLATQAVTWLPAV